MNARDCRIMNFFHSKFKSLTLAVCVCSFVLGCRTGVSSDDAALLSDSSTGNQCRWKGQTSYDGLLQQASYAYDLPPQNYTDQAIASPSITQGQLLEDLDCLKLTFQTAYSATGYFAAKGIDLVARIDALRHAIAADNRSYSRQEILNSFAKLHEGAFDGHAFYRFYNMTAVWQGQTQQIGTGVAPPYPRFVYATGRFTRDNSGRIQHIQANGSKVGIESCERMTVVSLASDTIPSTSNSNVENVTYVGYRGQTEFQSTASVTCKLVSGGDIQFPISMPTPFNDAFPSPELKRKGAELTTLNGNVQYLRIGNFPNPMTTEQQAIANTLTTTDLPLIIDVRGIGGGAEPFTNAIYKAIFTATQTQQTTKNEELISLLTFVGVAQVYIDMKAEWQLKPGITDAERASKLASLDQTLSYWRQGALDQSQQYDLSSVDDVKVMSQPSYVTGERPHPKQKPIVIIIDRNCGSQCEFLVSALRHHSMVQARSIIGVPTAGRLNFGSNGALFLPNTRINFIPSRVRSLHLPDAVEGEGIHPGQYVVTGDPKKIALDMIGSL